jgi:hypothetical protein
MFCVSGEIPTLPSLSLAGSCEGEAQGLSLSLPYHPPLCGEMGRATEDIYAGVRVWMIESWGCNTSRGDCRNEVVCVGWTWLSWRVGEGKGREVLHLHARVCLCAQRPGI